MTFGRRTSAGKFLRRGTAVGLKPPRTDFVPYDPPRDDYGPSFYARSETSLRAIDRLRNRQAVDVSRDSRRARTARTRTENFRYVPSSEERLGLEIERRPIASYTGGAFRPANPWTPRASNFSRTGTPRHSRWRFPTRENRLGSLQYTRKGHLFRSPPAADPRASFAPDYRWSFAPLAHRVGIGAVRVAPAYADWRITQIAARTGLHPAQVLASLSAFAVPWALWEFFGSDPLLYSGQEVGWVQQEVPTRPNGQVIYQGDIWQNAAAFPGVLDDVNQSGVYWRGYSFNNGITYPNGQNAIMSDFKDTITQNGLTFRWCGYVGPMDATRYATWAGYSSGAQVQSPAPGTKRRATNPLPMPSRAPGMSTRPTYRWGARGAAPFASPITDTRAEMVRLPPGRRSTPERMASSPELKVRPRTPIAHGRLGVEASEFINRLFDRLEDSHNAVELREAIAQGDLRRVAEILFVETGERFTVRWLTR